MDEFVDPRAFSKRGVQANSWVRPQPALGEFFVDLPSNPFVTNRDEARDVRPIIVDQPATEFEYVHDFNRCFCAPAARLVPLACFTIRIGAARADPTVDL